MPPNKRPPVPGGTNDIDAEQRAIMSITDESKQYHGRPVDVLRSVVPGDAPYDPQIGKTWVQLANGREIAVLNDEVKG